MNKKIIKKIGRYNEGKHSAEIGKLTIIATSALLTFGGVILFKEISNTVVPVCNNMYSYMVNNVHASIPLPNYYIWGIGALGGLARLSEGRKNGGR